MANDFSALSVVQLRELLKAKGVKNTSAMRKAELIERLEKEAGEAREPGDGSMVPSAREVRKRNEPSPQRQQESPKQQAESSRVQQSRPRNQQP